jgi:hypothetical protein
MTSPILRLFNRAHPLLWVVLLAGIMAFGFQGTRGLWDPDEGRYTNVALEMMQSGDYFQPHRHHETLHVTKPPVTYWALAASMQSLGRNEWAFARQLQPLLPTRQHELVPKESMPAMQAFLAENHFSYASLGTVDKFEVLTLSPAGDQ